MKKLMVVGGHSGDEAVMAGPIAARLAREGGSSIFVSVTNGDGGHHTLDRATYAVQKDIYDEYFKAVAEDPENRGLTDDALHALTARFVSRPVRGKPLSFVHSSGGAVDLTLADEQGRPLDMGCGFDEFTPLAATNALENANTPARDNRRLLYTVMINAGFTNYAAEWWHFDFGDLFYAAETKTAARYASIYDEGEIIYDKSAPSL